MNIALMNIKSFSLERIVGLLDYDLYGDRGYGVTDCNGRGYKNTGMDGEEVNMGEERVGIH